MLNLEVSNYPSNVSHHGNMKPAQLQKSPSVFGDVANNLVQVETQGRQTGEEHHKLPLRHVGWRLCKIRNVFRGF